MRQNGIYVIDRHNTILLGLFLCELLLLCLKSYIFAGLFIFIVCSCCPEVICYSVCD